MISFLSGKRVCVTGGAGFLGQALLRQLRELKNSELFVCRSADFDLTNAHDVARLFDAARPEVVFHLAAEVGGIGANQRHSGRYFYANMAMGLHLIEEARRRGISKFIQIGSVCSYPKHCPIPFREDNLWSGYPEETNAAYGVAKRTLGAMLDAYFREYGFPGVYVIPVNLYGPGDNFDPADSHVIPALIRKYCDAVDRCEAEVTCWGTGRATREFLYVDDAAEAIVRAAELLNDPRPVNLGTAEEIAIADLARMIAALCGFEGRTLWDESKPDGQPRRRLDTSRAESLRGWLPRVGLDEGLERTIDWWRERAASRQVTSFV